MTTVTATSTAPEGGRHLTVANIAAMIECSVYSPDLSRDDVARASSVAAVSGLAAVVCRPYRVAVAADAVSGSPVRIATALAGHIPTGPGVCLRRLQLEAEQALQDGARELALLATAARLPPAERRVLVAEIAAVGDLARSVGGLVRVALDTAALTTQELITGCRVVVDAGAGMVQAGTFYEHGRARLSQVQLIRREIGPQVVLKWTAPVRGLDVLLLAKAEGVDRFNADATVILAQAEDLERWGEIRVPVPGVDY